MTKENKRWYHLAMLCLTLIFILLTTRVTFATGSDAEYERIMKSTEEDLEYAIEHYESSFPDIDVYDRKAVLPLTRIEKARYTESADGIYRADMEGDNVAVIMCTGDLMCQKNQQKEAMKKYGQYIFNDNFAYVKNVLSKADFVVGNLETMLSESAAYFSEQPLVDDSPNCNAPSTYLDALRYAGFDMTVTANNHNCDTGAKGIFQTLGHLDQYKLIHTGLFRNKEEKRYKIVEIDGIKVAFLSYSTLYNKGKHYTKEGQNVLLNRYSGKKAEEDIEKARMDGAEYVITYIHWGIEYVNDQNEKQERIAKELADAGADYIIGSHPHCLQPYDRIKASDGRTVPVVYSMGNFVSQMKKQAITQESMILRIKLARNKSGKIYLKSDGYIPCKVMTEYKGNNFTSLPLTIPYNKGNTSTEAIEAASHIRQVIGDKLTMLGRSPITYMNIKLGYTKTVFTGKRRKPSVTVRDLNGHVLKAEEDYSLTWSDNLLPGLAKVKVSGAGDYKGSKEINFKIYPKPVTDFSKTKKEGSYRFSWNSSKGADYYRVYMKKPGETKYSLLKKTENCSIVIRPGKNAGTYRVRVAACKESSAGRLISEKSPSLSFTVR